MQPLPVLKAIYKYVYKLLKYTKKLFYQIWGGDFHCTAHSEGVDSRVLPLEHVSEKSSTGQRELLGP